MPRIVILHHYLYPDDVVSARLFDGLCAGLAEKGWSILALPSNRSKHNPNECYPPRETLQGMSFRRVWRPSFLQSSNLGRLCNAVSMLASWSRLAFSHSPDVLLVGSDPVFSILAARFWRLIHPKLVIAHWCFDLYPEAAIAAGLLSENSFLHKRLKKLLGSAYRSCDLITNIGPCMRDRLRDYSHGADEATLVPWALYEPPSIPPVDKNVRRSLFGNSRLGLMYSGNFGRAHSFREFFDLARMLRGEDIHFSFGVRGNRAQDVNEAITSRDSNISLSGFAPESELPQRLCAPDIHLVSLKSEWTGTVVPSKFFGSLAVGRPVLFAGSKDSSIARWIVKHQVGWIISCHSDLKLIASKLRDLSQDPNALKRLQSHCHQVYQDNFTRKANLNLWHELLTGLLEKKRSDCVLTMQREKARELCSPSPIPSSKNGLGP